MSFTNRAAVSQEMKKSVRATLKEKVFAVLPHHRESHDAFNQLWAMFEAAPESAENRDRIESILEEYPGIKKQTTALLEQLGGLYSLAHAADQQKSVAQAEVKAVQPEVKEQEAKEVKEDKTDEQLATQYRDALYHLDNTVESLSKHLDVAGVTHALRRNGLAYDADAKPHDDVVEQDMRRLEALADYCEQLDRVSPEAEAEQAQWQKQQETAQDKLAKVAQRQVAAQAKINEMTAQLVAENAALFQQFKQLQKGAAIKLAEIGSSKTKVWDELNQFIQNNLLLNIRATQSRKLTALDQMVVQAETERAALRQEIQRLRTLRATRLAQQDRQQQRKTDFAKLIHKFATEVKEKMPALDNKVSDRLNAILVKTAPQQGEPRAEQAPAPRQRVAAVNDTDSVMGLFSSAVVTLGIGAGTAYVAVTTAVLLLSVWTFGTAALCLAMGAGLLYLAHRTYEQQRDLKKFATQPDFYRDMQWQDNGYDFSARHDIMRNGIHISEFGANRTVTNPVSRQREDRLLRPATVERQSANLFYSARDGRRGSCFMFFERGAAHHADISNKPHFDRQVQVQKTILADDARPTIPAIRR